jgi:hypothetical protein
MLHGTGKENIVNEACNLPEKWRVILAIDISEDDAVDAREAALQALKSIAAVFKKGHSMRILTLYPYLFGKTWVFDDVRTGLKEEAFVLGMSEMITRLVTKKAIQNAEKGFARRWCRGGMEVLRRC